MKKTIIFSPCSHVYLTAFIIPPSLYLAPSTATSSFFPSVHPSPLLSFSGIHAHIREGVTYISSFSLTLSPPTTTATRRSGKQAGYTSVRRAILCYACGSQV